MLVKYINRLDFVNLFGLAIFATMIYGLVFNYLLPKIGISDPLSFKNIWPVIFFFLLPILKLIINICPLIKGNISSWFILFFQLINPILSVAGAILLDNTGNGSLAMLSVILIGLIFIITFLQKNPQDGTFKLSLYSAAVSLLLANSLRSNFLVGWDIHQEYLVYRLTSINNFWDINTFKDAYNACISITILPTIIHNLTRIDPLIIFKLVIPLIIGLIPVIVYQIGTKIIQKKMAYLGGFVFLIQAQYISQLPALLRQGIAFLFLGLFIDTLIKSNINQKSRNIALLVYGTGIILSHYSTTYITLILLILTKFISILINKLLPCKKNTPTLSFIVLGILFLITFLWNVLITDIAGGLFQTIVKVTENVGHILSFENKSEFVKNIFYQQSNNAILVNKYWNDSLEVINNAQDYQKYKITPVTLETDQPKSITEPIPLFFHIIIPWLFRLSIIIGFFSLIIRKLKNKESSLVISLILSMLTVTFSLMVLPYASNNYNFERLFQQTLIFLAPVSAVGFSFLLFRQKQILGISIIVVILLSFLSQSTGLIDRLVYGRSRWMFDGSGEQYYRYYSTAGEVEAINWLENNTDPNILLYADEYSKMRFLAFSDQKFSFISSQINPPVIKNYGYIFSGLAGTKANTVFASVNENALEFNFPHKYLSDTKNKIYSNSISNIYR